MSEELIRLREIESAAREVFGYPAGSPRDVWNRLAVALGETALHADCAECAEQSRRAEIGRLVEEMCRNGSLDGPLKIFPSRLADGPVRVSLAAFSGVRNGEAATLLEALRALAAEIGGKNA